MIKSYKITDNLFVNEQVIDMPKKEFKVEAKHQYIILDRSGSMWGELDKIADVIINYVDTLTEGSTVSLGYFSGNGQYGLSVPYVLKKEKDGVVNTINEYRHALGMTNFIEILDKVNNDVKEKSSLDKMRERIAAQKKLEQDMMTKQSLRNQEKVGLRNKLSALSKDLTESSDEEEVTPKAKPVINTDLKTL